MTLNASVTDDQLGQYFRRTVAIAERLDKSLSFERVMDVLQLVHDKKFEEAIKVAENVAISENPQIFKLLSKDQSLVIEAVDGTKTLANAKDVFKSGIDFDFKNWGTNKPGNATKEMAVQVYEMTENATFPQMFGSLGTNLDKLCFSQHQIKTFCKKYPNWLCADYATFFPFKVEDHFFVACVRVVSDGLFVFVRRFESGFVWLAGCRHRVVVPQLTV